MADLNNVGPKGITVGALLLLLFVALIPKSEPQSSRGANRISSVATLRGTDDGNDWHKASRSSRMGLCRDLAKRLKDYGHDANWYYDLLNTFYSGNDANNRRQEIAETAALGITWSELGVD